MHLTACGRTQLLLLLVLLLENTRDVSGTPEAHSKFISLGRTNVLARLPFFGGFRNLLRVLRPNAHLGRKSDYRSDFDENFVNYHGAQLWKIIFSPSRKRSGEVTRTEIIQLFVERFGMSAMITKINYGI